VVRGPAFLGVGPICKGLLSLASLAHCLGDALMPLRLDLAPLVYGVFTAGCVAWAAWDHYRVGRREKSRS
jgi:hypothetical protein